MKKFLTFVALQPPKQLHLTEYIPQDNEELKCGRKVHYPISILLETYAKKDEDVELLCIVSEDNEDVKQNLKTLKDEVADVEQDNGFRCKITELMISQEQYIKDHLDTFSKLIQQIEDGDDLYVCCTYGTKPIPIVEMMALNFAYQTKRNVSIKSVVYGMLMRENGEVVGTGLYDITALFFMTQIVNRMAEQKVKNPEDMIRSILDLED